MHPPLSLNCCPEESGPPTRAPILSSFHGRRTSAATAGDDERGLPPKDPCKFSQRASQKLRKSWPTQELNLRGQRKRRSLFPAGHKSLLPGHKTQRATSVSSSHYFAFLPFTAPVFRFVLIKKAEYVRSLGAEWDFSTRADKARRRCTSLAKYWRILLDFLALPSPVWRAHTINYTTVAAPLNLFTRQLWTPPCPSFQKLQIKRSNRFWVN